MANRMVLSETTLTMVEFESDLLFSVSGICVPLSYADWDARSKHCEGELRLKHIFLTRLQNSCCSASESRNNIHSASVMF